MKETKPTDEGWFLLSNSHRSPTHTQGLPEPTRRLRHPRLNRAGCQFRSSSLSFARCDHRACQTEQRNQSLERRDQILSKLHQHQGWARQVVERLEEKPSPQRTPCLYWPL